MLAIVDNYDSFTYNLYQMICSLHVDVKVFRNDQISIEELQGMNPFAIVISPGPGKPVNAGICVDLIKMLAPSIPILGVCLGHQAIAEAFGGEVSHAGQIVHGKSSRIFHKSRGLFATLPVPFEAGRYHSLKAMKENLPNILQIEAETEDGVIMALKHKDFPCYGVQFHPESILTPLGINILKAFIDLAQAYASKERGHYPC